MAEGERVAHDRFQDLVIGVSVNNLSGITGHRYEVPDLLHAAKEAEAMGFDAVWVHDAPLGRRTLAAFDPITLLSAIAGMTRRILLCTGILTPQLRNPVNLAAAWSTLHAVSGERTVLAVGTGAGKAGLVEREYQAVAALRADTELDPQRLYKERGRLFEEALQVVRGLWEQDKLSYSGTYYRFQDVTLGYARPHDPPPILIGAGNYYPKKTGGPVHHDWEADKAGTYRLGPYKRVADLGDGWITPHATPAEYAESWGKISTYAAEAWPARRYIRAYNAFVNVNEDPRVAWEEVRSHLESFHGPPVGDDLVDRWSFSGPPEVIAQRLRQYTDQGVTMFQLVIGSHEQLKQMRLVAEQVLPILKA